MKLPAFPASLRRFADRLPALPGSVALACALNLAAWPALRQLDWDALKGRRFCVHVRDTGTRMYFSVGERGFVPLAQEAADVTFTATGLDFARLALRLDDPDTLFFDRRLLIEGDTDLGLRVKNMLDSVDIAAVAEGMPAGCLTLRVGQSLVTSLSS